MNPVRAFLIICLPLVAAVLILGRPTVNTKTSFSETFQGYPCDGHCNQFRAGFETAESRQFKDNLDCQSLAADEQLGCLSYMHEYRIAHHDQI